MKKTLFFILLLALLPFTAQAEEVKIYGDDLVYERGTEVYTVTPENSSYTYVWDSEDAIWYKVIAHFDVVTEGNKLYITPKPETTSMLVNLVCHVYDENGDLIGDGHLSIIFDYR